MKQEYGEKKGESVFYASKNAGTIHGVDGTTTPAIDNDSTLEKDDTMTEAERFKLEKAGEHESDRLDSEELPVWADKLRKDILDSVGKMLNHRKDGEEPRRPEEAADCMDKKDSEEDLGEDPTENTQGQKKDARKADKHDRRDESEDEHEREEGREIEKKRLEAKKDSRHEGGEKALGEKEEKERLDREREGRARHDAQSAEIRDLRGKIKAMESQVGTLYQEPTFEDRNALADARTRADRMYQSLTGRPAYDPLPGEKPIAYRKRMADGLRKFSPRFKDERIERLDGQAFEIVEDQIYADAEEALKSPEVLPAGQLRAIKRMDRGREITEYIGDPLACWAPFMANGINVKIPRPVKH